MIPLPRMAKRGEGSGDGTMQDIDGVFLPALLAAEVVGAAAVLALAALMASMSMASVSVVAADTDGGIRRPPPATAAAVDRSASRRLKASLDICRAAARGSRNKGKSAYPIMMLAHQHIMCHVSK